MNRLIKFLAHPLFVVTTVIIIDQVFKIWIKTNMYLGEEIVVLGNWFIIHFTENNGMAFGIEFGNNYGKLFLTLFRLVAISGLIFYLFRFYKKLYPTGVIVCISLILAGAIGNVIDSTFYGMIFNESAGNIASFLPEGGGYAPLFFGKVVDMLYFPIAEGFLPSWMPIWGGDYFIFFRPVFNIADSAITIGVLTLAIFFRNQFREQSIDEKKEETKVPA